MQLIQCFSRLLITLLYLGCHVYIYFILCCFCNSVCASCSETQATHIHISSTYKCSQQGSHNPSLPPAAFVFFPFHMFSLSVVHLPPSSRLLGAFATDPPERGLMRANDGNACCRFLFINGSKLARRTPLFIISSLRSASALLFPRSITPSLCLLPFTSHHANGLAFLRFLQSILIFLVSCWSFSFLHQLLYEYQHALTWS